MKKYVKNSHVIMHELILPNDTNNLGNIFGGKVMQYMDLCAAMSAYKFSRTAVVTASVDRLDFLAPATVGDMLILKSSVNYAHKTSMEIGVRIDAENVKTGQRKHTASAYLTFVSLGEDGKPQKISDIIPETKDEKRRYKEGKERHAQRIKRLKKKG